MELNAKTLSQHKPHSIFLVYAIPAIMSNMISGVAILVDGIFISKYVGPEGFAAINIIWPMGSFIFGIYVMLVIGAASVAGKLLGENKMMRANLVFTQTIVVIVFVSLSASICIFIFKDYIQPFLGARDQILVYTNEYITPMAIAIFFWGFGFTLAQFARLNGSPRYISYAYGIAAVTNIIFNYIFMAILDFGIAGAGWATVISYVTSFSILICYYFRKKCKFKLIKIYAGWGYIVKAAFNGFSELLNSASGSIIPWLFNITALRLLGSTGVLAYSVANYALVLFALFAYSIGDSLQPLVSISYGARKPKKIRIFLKIAAFSSMGMGLIVSIILLIFPSLLSHALLINVSDATYEYANTFLRGFALAFVLVGINIVMTSYYTAVQCAGASATVAFLRTLLLPIIFILTLPNILGVYGLIIVLPLVETITLVVSLLLLKNRKAAVLIKMDKNIPPVDLAY